MSKYKWVKRSVEWIKENPGKPTMFRVNDDGIEAEVLSVVPSKVVLKKESKLLNGASGIYIILCEAEKHVYVGQSINIENRLRSHKMYILKEFDSDSSSIYDKMRRHWMIHGPDGFEFRKYIGLLKPSNEELLKIEAKTMIEFLRKGYVLYNLSIPKEAFNHCLWLSDDNSFTISFFMEKVRKHNVSNERLDAFLKTFDFEGKDFIK